MVKLKVTLFPTKWNSLQIIYNRVGRFHMNN